jgi:hypothetical protein
VRSYKLYLKILSEITVSKKKKKNSPLGGRLFAKLCVDMEAEHTVPL